MPTDKELLRELNQLINDNIEDRAASERLKTATGKLRPEQTTQKRANIERIAVLNAKVQKREKRIQEIKGAK